MAARQVEETAEQFSARIFEIVNGGIVSLSIALGMKSGLFEVLIEHHETPKTPEELADLAGLKERYVREWLGAMTCAHIVDLDPATGKYHLPSHRVDSFKPGTVSSMMATTSKAVPYIGERFQSMVECMKKDGPLDRGIRMLDLGCGRGMVTRILAQRFPNSHFTGLDIDQSHVDIARDRSPEKMTNLEYICVDAAQMPSDWATSFDYVFCRNVLHDAPRPDVIVDEVKRVLKKDGFVSIIEYNVDSRHANNIDNPMSGFLYTMSLFHCLPMSCGIPGSHGLGLMWGVDRVLDFLNDKGFEITTSTTKGANGLHFLCKMPFK